MTEVKTTGAEQTTMSALFLDGITKFSGDDKSVSSTKWAQDLEDNSEIFNWTPQQKLIFARRSLVGTAELWLKSEKTFKSYDELKTALQKEFPDTANTKEMHEVMSSRKKQKNESYYEYMLIMKELGRRAKFPDYVSVQYIIDGISDHEPNKSILYGANSYATLKEKLSLYEKMKAKMKNNVQEFKDNVNRRVNQHSRGSSGYSAGGAVSQATSSANRTANVNVTRSSDSRDSHDSQTSNEYKIVNKQEVPTTKPMIMVKIKDLNVNALIDSGSDVNLMTYDCFTALQTKKYDENLSLTGLGRMKVNSLGKVFVNITIDGRDFQNVLFHIVNKDVIPFPMILGQELLNKITMIMSGCKVKFMSKSEEWLSNLCCFSDSPVDVSHIPDHLLRSKILQCVESYNPVKIKEAPIQLKIVLKDDVPVAQRARRLSLTEQKIVENQVKEWLDDGIIRIVKDEFPLPVIDDMIDKLCEARIFSVLDLKNGFFHLRVSEESVAYTSFVTHNGQYEFLRAPFGLSICPKYFMRFVSIIFRDLISQGIMIIFIDDILITAANQEQAVERLQLVLKVASEYGLQINWKKANLIKREIEYLGHIVKDGEVRPSPEKTEAVHLLRKDKEFTFNDEQRVAFQTLKEKLADAPVLRIFNPSLKTELHTDASSVAYSAILMQHHPDTGLHPVHYMSRKTNDIQSRHSSYELEATAVIEDYSFEVEHRSGSKMNHVDALSRYPFVGIISLHDQVKLAQDQDEGLKAIKEILKNNNNYKDFWIENDILFKGEKKLLVIPKNMEKEVLKRVHSNGHFSKKKMKQLIEQDYYIKEVDRKIEDFIVTCIPCLLATKKEGKQEGFLNPIEKGIMPLDTLHLDHVGPLTQTTKQYNHILTIVDAFTKFVWLFPTKSTSSRETLNKLEIHQQTFGNPRRIITDRGTAFTSHEFTEYCKEEDIEHVKITTGVPRGNGQVERIHKIIIPLLTKLCMENSGLWYRHVSRVQRAINRRIHTIINEDRDELRKKAKEQIFKVQEENSKYFNKNRKISSQYTVGDLVAIKRTQFGSGLKLKPKYLGPYKVVKVKRNDRYDLEKVDSTTEGSISTSSSADNMKRWPLSNEE
ncbi:unnamed protein product [Colias eurytheme]|nr:unnamed protein product [Colias eurytheme]